MRGIVLAGGTGSRMGDVTKGVNKHCLLVYDRPMIQWAIQTLTHNGINDITIVTSPQGIGQLSAILGEKYTYKVQSSPGGIPQAIMCAQDHSNRDVAVILGDNMFLPPPQIIASRNPHCYLHRSMYHDLSQLGIATLENDNIVEIVEKPKTPRSDFVVTGLYTFTSDVFTFIPTLKESERGEYEISDLLNYYASNKLLKHTIVRGFWGDAGTILGLIHCSAAASIRG